MTHYSFFAFLLLSLWLTSCASPTKAPERKIANWSEADAGIKPIKSSQLASDESLTQLVKKAKQQGDFAVSYVGTDLFLKANEAAIRGDLETSVRLLSQVHELDPSDRFVTSKLAIELVRVGNLERAEVLLAQLRNEPHDDEVMDLVYAGVLTARGKNQEARDLYTKILEEHPTSEEACIFLVKAYVASDERAKAHALLDRCERQIEVALFPYFKGKLAVEAQDFKAARRHFSRALKVDPDYHQAHVALALIEEASEDYEAALKHYQQILASRPMNYSVLNRVVQLMFVQEKYKEVIPYAETLLSLDPSDIALKIRLGILYTNGQDYERAIQSFEEVLEVVPDSDKVLYYLGALYQEIQDYPQAIQYFGQIASESPLFHDGHLQIANMLHAWASEEPEKGEEFLHFTSQAIEHNQDLKFDFVVLQASYYEEREDYARAVELMKSLHDQERFSEGHRYYLAALLEKSGEHRESLAQIQEILKTNPNHAHALNFLGYSLLEKGEDLSLAYEYIQRAVELEPEDGYIRDSLGWYYYKMGEYAKALKEIQRAWELVQSSDPIISKHLAIVYQALENYDMARKFYREAISLCRSEAERHSIVKALERLDNLDQRRALASEPSELER